MMQELQEVQAGAVCVASEERVQRALDEMALAIEQADLPGPVVMLCVMTGGLMVASGLLRRLTMPLALDYIHATRYQEQTSGAQVQWKALPTQSLQGQSVLVVDDIYDEGITLDAIVAWCMDSGASRVLTAVLVDKQHQRKGSTAAPDVVGLYLPDHYLYGMGMDYKGFLRNKPAIYAVAT